MNDDLVVILENSPGDKKRRKKLKIFWTLDSTAVCISSVRENKTDDVKSGTGARLEGKRDSHASIHVSFSRFDVHCKIAIALQSVLPSHPTDICMVYCSLSPTL